MDHGNAPSELTMLTTVCQIGAFGCPQSGRPCLYCERCADGRYWAMLRLRLEAARPVEHGSASIIDNSNLPEPPAARPALADEGQVHEPLDVGIVGESDGSDCTRRPLQTRQTRHEYSRGGMRSPVIPFVERQTTRFPPQCTLPCSVH